MAVEGHMRRPFYEFFTSTKSPLAAEVLARIRELYAIEAEIRGHPGEYRRTIRQDRSRPIVDALHAWLQDQAGRVSAASDLAKAIRYAIRHWPGLVVFLDDGRVEMDTNVVERAIRPSALTRKNALFCWIRWWGAALGDGDDADSDRQAERRGPHGLVDRCARARRKRTDQDPRPAHPAALELENPPVHPGHPTGCLSRQLRPSSQVGRCHHDDACCPCSEQIMSQLSAARCCRRDAYRAVMAERGAWANIKPMPRRVHVPLFSPWLYRYRNLVERFFSKLKHSRAIATRFEKHDANYPALVKLAATRIWMRFMSR